MNELLELLSRYSAEEIADAMTKLEAKKLVKEQIDKILADNHLTIEEVYDIKLSKNNSYEKSGKSGYFFASGMPEDKAKKLSEKYLK